MPADTDTIIVCGCTYVVGLNLLRDNNRREVQGVQV